MLVLLTRDAPKAERTAGFRFVTPETELEPPILRVSVLLWDSSLRCLAYLLESREIMDYHR